MSNVASTLRGAVSVWSRHFWLYRKTFVVNCIAPISEPIIYLLAFGFGLSPLIQTVSLGNQTVPYLEFLAPGMIAVAILFQSFFEGAYGSYIRISFQQTWAAQLTTPLTFSEIFIGDWLWAATKGLIAGLATALVACAWGALPLAIVLYHLPFMVVGSLLFASLGLVTAGWVKTVDQINLPVFLFVVPMFTLCGTYFPRDVLPSALRLVAEALPLSPLINLLRQHLLTDAPSRGVQIALYTLILLIWLVILLILAYKALAKKVFR